MSNICLKAHFEDAIDSPFYLTASLPTETLNNLSLKMSASEEDILSLVLLSNIFTTTTNPAIGYNNTIRSAARIYNADLNPLPGILVGYLEDGFNNPDHDSESLSLITYTMETFKETMKAEVPFNYDGTYEDWVAGIDAVPLENLVQYLQDAGVMPTNMLVHNSLRTLVISRPSEEYLMSLESSLEANYDDFFDTFKSKVAGTNIAAGTSNGTPFVVSGDNSVDISVPLTLESLELFLGGGDLEDAA